MQCVDERPKTTPCWANGLLLQGQSRGANVVCDCLPWVLHQLSEAAKRPQLWLLVGTHPACSAGSSCRRSTAVCCGSDSAWVDAKVIASCVKGCPCLAVRLRVHKGWQECRSRHAVSACQPPQALNAPKIPEAQGLGCCSCHVVGKVLAIKLVHRFVVVWQLQLADFGLVMSLADART
jgi:hypothetical protein